MQPKILRFEQPEEPKKIELKPKVLFEQLVEKKQQDQPYTPKPLFKDSLVRTRIEWSELELSRVIRERLNFHSISSEQTRLVQQIVQHINLEQIVRENFTEFATHIQREYTELSNKLVSYTQDTATEVINISIRYTLDALKDYNSVLPSFLSFVTESESQKIESKLERVKNQSYHLELHKTTIPLIIEELLTLQKQLEELDCKLTVQLISAVYVLEHLVRKNHEFVELFSTRAESLSVTRISLLQSIALVQQEIMRLEKLKEKIIQVTSVLIPSWYNSLGSLTKQKSQTNQLIESVVRLFHGTI